MYTIIYYTHVLEISTIERLIVYKRIKLINRKYKPNRITYYTQNFIYIYYIIKVEFK